MTKFRHLFDSISRYATQILHLKVTSSLLLTWTIVCGPVFSADLITADIAKSLDSNKDGKVSLSEFLTGKKKVQEQRRLFFQYDTNEDLSLSLDELKVKTPYPKLSATNSFRYLDQNNDHNLTLKEYLATNTNPKLAERNFKVVDFDGNGQLALEEYKALPNLLPLEKRSAIPDPIAELASSAQQKWQAIQKTADQNADGQLSKAEWPKAELQKQLTPLAEVNFTVWDADKNGQVTSKEAAQLISVAYGMREVNGALLRNPNGLVLYRSYIQPTDKDNDYRLSKAEYMPSIRRPKERVEAEYTKMDADKDGFLTYPEMTRSNTTSVDEFSYFLNSDKDMDGLLSAKELVNINSNGAFKLRLPQGFVAFDQDRDGKLNLREFRLAPIGCSYITLRIYSRSDLDHDAALSWQEFYKEESPQVIGLAWELFQRFDRNQSGKLELNEFEFRVDPSKISPEKTFALKDKDADGQLSLEEYLSLVASTKPEIAKRNFKLIDFDNNNQLSFEEYKATPGLFSAAKRGPIPDPVADFAMDAQNKWQVLQKTADQNKDGQLSKEEWPLAELQKQLTPLADVKFTVWDKDQNGQVSSKEAERLIAIAYGMQQVNGAPLRTTTGQVLYRFYISRTDKDNDFRLSKAEYLPSVRLPKEKVLENFTKMDRDHDNYLTYSELTTSTATNIDEFNYFVNSDKDLDGLLSPKELLKVGSNSSAKKILPQGIAAFDEDKDGKFSLREFRLAPVGVSYVTLRVYDRIDLDHDGILSWNEFYHEPSPQLIGLAWELFKRFDRNQNSQLEPDEFEFRIDHAKLPPEKTFAFNDKDSDGRLTLEEYLALVPTTKPQLAKRNFNVVDFDGNDQLDFEEFKALPGLLPASKRGDIPDPVVELAAKAFKKWQVVHKAADRNADGQLSQSEWPRKTKLQKNLPALADVIFSTWDRDLNGQVTSSEAKQLIDIAYGIQHITGYPLRTPNGLVLYRSYIRPADKNGDHRLSQREYFSSLRQPFKKILALFTEMDADKDRFLDYSELTTSSTTNIDEFNYFLSTDKDLDGFLSPEELLKINSNDAVEERLPQGMAAFDEDHDGKFSLREFRMSPVGCNYVTLRVYGREDLDHDGMLSWKEFYHEPSPEVIGLAWELFQRFDRNRNNQLEINEFEFRFNPTLVPPKIYFQFADKDKNGMLEFSEVFTVKEPENQKTQGYERYKVQLNKAKSKFEQDDQNSDSSLDENEFILAHETAQEAEKQHLRALGRLKIPNEEPKWLFPVLMTFNVILVLGVAAYFIRRKLR